MDAAPALPGGLGRGRGARRGARLPSNTWAHHGRSWPSTRPAFPNAASIGGRQKAVLRHHWPGTELPGGRVSLLRHSRGHTLIDRELYVPQDWLDERARCQQAGIPDTIPFRTKPDLAIQMLERLHQARVPVAWVVADSVYGGYAELRTWLETHQQPYVGAVACDEPVVLQTPAGVRRVEVRDVPALLLTDSSWQRLAMSEGSKGPRLFDWACVPLLHRGAMMAGTPC